MDALLLVLLLVVFAGFLFFTSRKQRKAMSDMRQLQNSLEPGDRVMTSSGLRATVSAVDADTVDLELAPGVVTTWIKAAIRERVQDGDADEPEDEAADDEVDENHVDSAAADDAAELDAETNNHTGEQRS